MSSGKIGPQRTIDTIIPTASIIAIIHLTKSLWFTVL